MMLVILGYVCSGVSKRKNQPFYKKYGPPFIVFIAVQLIMADPTRHVLLQSHYPLDDFPAYNQDPAKGHPVGLNVTACVEMNGKEAWIKDTAECNTCFGSSDQHKYSATTFKSLGKTFFPSFYPDGSQFIETCDDLGGKDSQGNNCSWYNDNPCECGKHDRPKSGSVPAWNASVSCCQCGGGGGPCKGSPDGGLHLHCLTEVGWIFTILFTYSGFLMLMWGVLWNANICQIIARIRTRWATLKQQQQGFTPVDTAEPW